MTSKPISPVVVTWCVVVAVALADGRTTVPDTEPDQLADPDAGRVVLTVPVGSARETPGAVGVSSSCCPQPDARITSDVATTTVANNRFRTVPPDSFSGPPGATHRPLRLALCITLCDDLTAVALASGLAQGELDLGAPFLEVQRQRHE